MKKGVFGLGSARGFTLLEILVVIAIIGIMSGIILTIVNDSRTRAKDARIKTELKSMKTVLELGFNGSRYLDLTSYVSGATGPAIQGALVAAPGGPNYVDLNKIRSDIKNQVGPNNAVYFVVSKNSSGVTAYALYSQLASNAKLYYCVDSAGNVNPKAPTNTEIVCPPADLP